MTPAGSAVSTPLWEELFMGVGPTLTADPDVVTCTLIPRYEAVKAARDFARTSLHHWGLSELFNDVALVASELVTNALRHALQLRMDDGEDGPPEQRLPPIGVDGRLPIRISLVHRAPQVVCAVSDPSSVGPVARDADYIAESGRGLHLVDSFSCSWGWHPLAGAGKVVWALFEAQDTQDAPGAPGTQVAPDPRSNQDLRGNQDAQDLPIGDGGGGRHRKA